MAVEHQSQPKNRLHLAHIEGLRAVAALTVFVNHAYAHARHPGYHGEASWWESLVGYSMIAGHLSVSVFIVLSGFCLTLPIAAEPRLAMKTTAVAFMMRRARRILPPYYAALLLCLALIGTVIGDPTNTLWDVPIAIDRVAVVSHFLLLQDFFGTSKINYVFWSIAVEWHIYFLFPVYVLVARRFGLLTTVIAALFLGYALRFGLAGTRVERANPHYLGLFALGMAAAAVVRSPSEALVHLRSRAFWPWLTVGLFGAVVTLCLFFGFHNSEVAFPYVDLPVGLWTFALLVRSSTATQSWMRHGLSWKPLVFVGTFSYSLYLVHAPLLQLLWQYPLSPWTDDKQFTFALLMSVGLIVVLAGSYGFHMLFERPFMTAKAAKRRTPVAAVPAAAGKP